MVVTEGAVVAEVLALAVAATGAAGLVVGVPALVVALDPRDR